MPGKKRRISFRRGSLPRPSVATVISVVALSIALGGSATAGVIWGDGAGNAVTAAKKKAKKKKKKSTDKQRTTRVVGPKGEVGAQGPQGATGAQGPAGADGLSGATGSEGPQGPPGADGQDGEDGQDGLDGLDGQDGQDGDNTVRLGAQVAADGSIVPPVYSNPPGGVQIQHDITDPGIYQIVFTGPQDTRVIATATATLQDDTTPALISTSVTNQQQASVVAVTIRALPGMGGTDLPFAVQVLKMVP